MSNLNEIENEVPFSNKKHKKKFQWKRYLSLSNVCFFLTVILAIVGGLLMADTVHIGAESAQNAYENAKNESADVAYNMFYDTAYTSAERKYHVSNKATIQVDAIKEEANLEVLKVNDVEYVIETRGDNKDNIEVWMEFYGEGVYTVNMQASEFIVDADRKYVLVRVPKPELTNCRITNTNRLLWENGIINKNNSVGTDLAVEMRNKGYTALNNYMKSNTKFYKSAKDSASVIIIDLVRGLNSELTDLTVEVEFVE